MYLGRVVGTVVATQKVAGLEGVRLLVVQPVSDTGAHMGGLQVAADATATAGSGDLVALVGSREAALAMNPTFVPVDAAITGIVDHVEPGA